MPDYINFIFENIGKAFSVMQSFYVLPGINLLGFLVIFFILHILVDILWFGRKTIESNDKEITKEKRK